jgi:hypothetical protein
MSAEASTAKPAKPAKTFKTGRLVEVAPDSEAPETRHRLSTAKGILIGAGICAAFWAAIAAAVIVRR